MLTRDVLTRNTFCDLPIFITGKQIGICSRKDGEEAAAADKFIDTVADVLVVFDIRKTHQREVALGCTNDCRRAEIGLAVCIE